jgi:hypothetical protein
MTTQAIDDEPAIRNLVNRHADAASRRDPLGVATTFITGGEWHHQLAEPCQNGYPPVTALILAATSASGAFAWITVPSGLIRSMRVRVSLEYLTTHLPSTF